MNFQSYIGSCYIHHEHSGAGFSSIYLATLSAILEALDKNLKPYVDSNRSWFNPTYDFTLGDSIDKNINPWNWWFNQSELDLTLPKYESYLHYSLIKHPTYEFLEAGMYTIDVNTSQYAAGSYIIRIQDEITTQTKHWIKN